MIEWNAKDAMSSVKQRGQSFLSHEESKQLLLPELMKAFVFFWKTCNIETNIDAWKGPLNSDQQWQPQTFIIIFFHEQIMWATIIL